MSRLRGWVSMRRLVARIMFRPLWHQVFRSAIHDQKSARCLYAWSVVSKV
ncbi:hypothetical protein ACFV0Y_24750 [Streptomyces sp. NPDC059569]